MEQKIASIYTPDIETQLTQAGNVTVMHAKAMRIDNPIGYEMAAEFLRGIKAKAKQITDYWSPAKQKAKAAHQELCDKEKAMLRPLSEAEDIIKTNMTNYQRTVEAERRKAEEEARRLQREERDRLLAEALAADQAGNVLDAEIGLSMAAMVEDMKSVPTYVKAPAATGISTRKVWKARITDGAIVPISAHGVEIRPINLSALESLARLTKGTAQIPGVEFYEDCTISARAR